jgi:hypothetical protein
MLGALWPLVHAWLPCYNLTYTPLGALHGIETVTANVALLAEAVDELYTLCYAMLCCAVLCYAMLCYAMPCYAMLCYAMLC